MKTSTLIVAVVAVIVVVGGIYWFVQSSSTTTTPEPTAQTTDDAQATVPPTLSVGTSPTLGSYLTAQNGMTLYTYNNDTAGASSTCTAACATTWPPYVVSSVSEIIPDTAMTGAVATILRDDGTLQVTYNGMPLYFYSQDTAPGDTSGSGVGDVWSIAHP